MKKDFYKATEKYLYNYPRLKTSLKNLRLQLDHIRPEGPGGVSYGGVCEHNHIADPTANEALDIIKAKDILNEQIKKTKEKLELIESCLKRLSEVERIIIEGYYFKGKNFNEVSNFAGYSTRQASRIKRRTIKKLEVELFGDTE